jgi:predicted nucleic acid-binding protein
VNYLLDTDHWSYLQRRDTRVVRYIQSLLDAATPYMPVVTQAELLAGVELAVSDPRQQELRTVPAQAITLADVSYLVRGSHEHQPRAMHSFEKFVRKASPDRVPARS